MDAFLDIVNEHLLDPPDTLVRIESMCLLRGGRAELNRARSIWGGTLIDHPSEYGWTSVGEVLELNVPNRVAGALCAVLEVRRVLPDGTSCDITDETVRFAHLG